MTIVVNDSAACLGYDSQTKASRNVLNIAIHHLADGKQKPAKFIETDYPLLTMAGIVTATV